MPDFKLENHGSIFLLRPLSEAAQSWADEYLPADAPMFGDAIAIEHRYAVNVAEGIVNDGLTIE